RRAPARREKEGGGGRGGPGGRALAWYETWLPLMNDGGGGHFWVDPDPAPGGGVGEIIHLDPHGGRVAPFAPSLSAFLDQVRARLQRGEIDLSPFEQDDDDDE